MTASKPDRTAEANRKAAAVFGAMAAGASGNRSSYDQRDGTWTTHHGRDSGSETDSK